MRPQGVLLGLLLLQLFAVFCHATFIFPDQYERMKNEMKSTTESNVIESHKEIHDFSSWNDNPNEDYNPPNINTNVNSNVHSNPNNLTKTLFDDFLPPKWRDHVRDLMSHGITKFTLDLDKTIESSSPPKNGNLVFSPISVTVTLAMILLASSGQTFNEVAKILGLESGLDITHHSEIVHQMFGLLLQESGRGHLLNSAAPECNFAFGIFVEDGYPIREEFKTASEKVYKSETMRVDFSHRGREAQTMINDWVKQKTKNKISSILDNPPDPSTAVLILSALYFKGEWNQHFMEIPEEFKRQKFHVSPTETVDVNMMFNEGEFPFYENKNLDMKIIGLPYKGLEVTMYGILPVNPSTPLKDLKKRLTVDMIDQLINNATQRVALIQLPKLKLSSTLSLEKTLHSLGLKSLFDPDTSDLSILSQAKNTTSHRRRRRRTEQPPRPVDNEFIQFLNSAKLPDFGIDKLRNSETLRNPKLYVDNVIHKVDMDVNEHGTEAAAVTGISIDRTIISNTFIANRPFLIFVRHNPSKTIWFWASITRPEYVP